MPNPSIKAEAKQQGLSRDWFKQLSDELGITERDLEQLMKQFRSASRVQDELRRDYPTDRRIEDFGESTPQSHTVDFVLSFLGDLFSRSSPDQFPNRNTTFQKFGLSLIQKTMKSHKLEIMRALDAEKWRRTGFWERKKLQIDSKLSGTYMLNRFNSGGLFVNEVLHFKMHGELNQVLNGYWHRSSQRGWLFYSGNFFISGNFLYGTFLNSSTDAIIKPVNLSILSEHKEEITSMRPLLTGAITGTNASEDTFFQYPVVLQRLQERALLDSCSRLGKAFGDVQNINTENFTMFANDVLGHFSQSPASEEVEGFLRAHRNEFSSFRYRLGAR